MTDIDISEFSETTPDLVLELREDGTFLDGEKIKDSEIHERYREAAQLGKVKLAIIADDSIDISRALKASRAATGSGIEEVFMTSKPSNKGTEQGR